MSDRNEAAAQSVESQNEAARDLQSRYPLLWEKAEQFDFAERLGGCADPLLAEIYQAMHELWLIRQERMDG